MDFPKRLVDINDYEKVKPIGRGSYSTVYKIKKKDTGKFYAAKFLGEMNEDNKKYIKNEIKFMSEFSNETIIPFYGYALKDFEGNDNVIIITKYYETGTLNRCYKGMIKRMVYDVLAGIAYGMIYLHKNGIIHRDLKPENIFIDEAKKPIIADFGIAKKAVHESVIQTGGKFTPIYCAPEAINAVYSYKSDIFSFGIMMYQVITKLDPYPGVNSQFQIFDRILNNDRPKFPEGLDIEEKMKDLIEKCWDPYSESRPTFEEIFNKIYEIKPTEYIQRLKENLASDKIKSDGIKLHKHKRNIDLMNESLEKNQIKKNIKSDEKNKKEYRHLRLISPPVDKRMYRKVEASIDSVYASVDNDTMIDPLKNDKMNNRIKQNESKIKELESKIEYLLNNMQYDKSKMEQSVKNEIKKSLKNQEEEINKKIDFFSKENNLLKEQIIKQHHNTKYQIKQYEIKIDELERNIEDMRNDMLKNKSSIELFIKGEIKKGLKNQEEGFYSKIDSLSKENNSLKEQIIKQENETNDKIKQYEDRIKQYETRINELENNIEGICHKTNFEQIIKNEIKKSLKNQEEAFNKEINSLKKQISDQDNKIKKYEDRIVKLEEQNLNIKNKMESNLNTIKKEFNKQIETNMTNIEDMIVNSTEQQSILEHNMKTIEEELNKKIDFIQDHEIEDKMKNYEDKIEILETSIVKLTENNDQIKSLEELISIKNDEIKDQFKNIVERNEEFEQNIKNELDKNAKYIEDYVANNVEQQSIIEQNIKNQEEINETIEIIKSEINQHQHLINDIEDEMTEMQSHKNNKGIKCTKRIKLKKKKKNKKNEKQEEENQEEEEESKESNDTGHNDSDEEEK